MKRAVAGRIIVGAGRVGASFMATVVAGVVENGVNKPAEESFRRARTDDEKSTKSETE